MILIRKIGYIIIILLFCLPNIQNVAAAAQQQEDTTETAVEQVHDEQQTEDEPSSFIARSWSLFEHNQYFQTIKALLVISIWCVIVMVILLIWILINRNRMMSREVETQRLMEEFEGLLFDYLTSERSESVYKKIARTALSDSNREILINQIRELSKSMTMSAGVNEKAREQLRYLYTHHLHLDQDSMRKLYSSKWHIQVKGFRELAFMDITDANNKIQQALKSRNDILRMEAQLALLRLNKDDPFGFLDHLVHPFSLWEQLNVYELIAIHNLPIPQFSRWTTSQNKTVVIFSLRMIQVFKQKQAVNHVIDCLEHEDKDVRHAAITVCGEIQLRETFAHLKHIYKNEDYENCLAIVQALGKMPDESMLGFLKLVLDKEDDVVLQIESAKAISRMGEVGIAALVKLMKSEYKNYQIIIRHVLDKRIF